MTETPANGSPAGDTDLSDLREAIAQMQARLDRIEAQAATPSPVMQAQARLGSAWEALRGGPTEPPVATGSGGRGMMWTALTICAVLVALILGVELVEEVFDSLWHLGRWID